MWAEHNKGPVFDAIGSSVINKAIMFQFNQITPLLRWADRLKLSVGSAFIIGTLALACSSHGTRPRLSEEEKAKRLQALFQRWDENHDGALSREELRTALNARALGFDLGNDVDLMLRKKQTGKTHPRATPRPFTRAEIERAIEDAFRLRDADLNGRLTEEEFKRVLVERPSDDQDVEFWENLL